MIDSPLASRTFSALDQRRFAAVSGDHNPIHLDPIAARRTQAGMCVVHGVHAAIWAIDALIGSSQLSAPIARLKVQFNKFIPLDRTVVLSGLRRVGEVTRAFVVLDGVGAISLSISHGPAEIENEALLSEAVCVPSREPAALDLSDIPGRTGWLASAAEEDVADLFPRAAEVLGRGRLRAITKLSTLVGMVCPGLHSMLSSLDLTITTETKNVTGLSFAVNHVDDRFRRADIAVAGLGIRGTVAAFVRQPPVDQPRGRDMIGRVNTNEFSGTTALIVGGSRGLGALTARIIAAGGGRVIITYAVGVVEAEEIGREIGSAQCRVIQYDVRGDATCQLSSIGEINQIYYFATPHIFPQKQKLFDRAIFSEFSSYYVDGFDALCVALQSHLETSISVFYPSSVAVEDRPRGMTEYAMAKAAGEVLCRDMDRYLPKIRVVAHRLPRLLTDQTAVVLPVQTDDAVDTMLPIVRAMCATTRV